MSGYLYAIAFSDGVVKIGFSVAPEKRLMALRSTYPNLKAFPLGVLPAERREETLLHRQLRAECVRGREWYRRGPLVSQFVAGLSPWPKYKRPVVTWAQVARRLRELEISQAALARAVNVSESTITAGIRRGSRLQPSTASAVRRKLDELKARAA